MTVKRRPFVERFWECVERRSPDECWPWVGTTNNRYGCLSLGGHQGRRVYAHRASWELHNCPLPDGMDVLHKCDNPPCVNPNHLFLGTQADNVRDMNKKGRKARGNDVNAVRGNRHYRTKIKDEDVAEVCRAYEAGANGPELARRYGVCRGAIYYVVKKRHRTQLGSPA